MTVTRTLFDTGFSFEPVDTPPAFGSEAVLANGYVFSTSLAFDPDPHSLGTGFIIRGVLRASPGGPILFDSFYGDIFFGSWGTYGVSALGAGQIEHAYEDAFGVFNVESFEFRRQTTGDAANNVINGDALVDIVAGGAGNDTISGGGGNDLLDGEAGNDKVNGGAGADTVSGLGGNDILDGGAGNDSLLGGAGIDSLTGGAGLDRLDGGADGDFYHVDFADVVQDSGAGGIDRVFSNGTYQLAAGSGVEQLATRAGVVGGNLIGDEGANAITGNAGANILMGLAGDDAIFGADGLDRLVGGTGRDRMSGGAVGGDTFQFAAGDSAATATSYDTVQDFATGVDRFDLSIFAGPPAASAYAETNVVSNNFATLKSAAEAQLGGGVKAVFVAGSSHGWLFWNTDATANTAEETVLLLNRNSVDDFSFADLA
jgi:Ca2+-binding RTX toxin-like protein